MLANNYLPFNEVFGIVRYLPMEIKMNKIFTSALLLLVALTTGCSINHPVAKDYDQHLAKFGLVNKYRFFDEIIFERDLFSLQDGGKHFS